MVMNHAIFGDETYIDGDELGIFEAISINV